MQLCSVHSHTGRRTVIKIIVLPELIYEQYVNQGVVFSNLTDLDYLIEVSSIKDLIEIGNAVEQYPNNFIVDECFEILQNPTTVISSKASTEFKYKTLATQLLERIESQSIRDSASSAVPEFGVYTLKRIDEYLWVAVQKSLPSVSSDPVKESVNGNKQFINDMVGKLMEVFKLEQLSKTHLFGVYLESNRV